LEDEQKQHEGLAIDLEKTDNSMDWDGMDADAGILLADGYE